MDRENIIITLHTDLAVLKWIYEEYQEPEQLAKIEYIQRLLNEIE